MPQCDCWAHQALIPKTGRRRRPAAVAVVVDLPNNEGLTELIRDAVRVQVDELDPVPDEPADDDPGATDDEGGS